jgi:hypothetical protein
MRLIAELEDPERWMQMQALRKELFTALPVAR